MNTKLDITVIILTYNEQIHIRRCLQNVSSFAEKIYVIDCFSTDKTAEIAVQMGATVIQHPWQGNQAAQFNWALENISISTEWILRLDADEYLLSELIEEITLKLPTIKSDITGIEFKRRHIFLGKWMKRGVYPVEILRLFRKGSGIYESRLMDEHIQLLNGRSIIFDNDFCDHNLNDISYFCHKHVDYSIREAAELLNLEFGISNTDTIMPHGYLGQQAASKRSKKLKYAHQPLFWRSFAYFCYRYFLKLGLMEGKEGFLWHFLQGWWYRTLVDAKVYEIKKACGNNREVIRKYLFEKYRIEL